MIDVSDGLSSESLHICKQSNLGCIIYEDKIPIHEEARQFAYKLELDPTACALSGGEDYELLFTISLEHFDKVKALKGITIIGHIVEEDAGVNLITANGSVVAVQAQGFNHFREE